MLRMRSDSRVGHFAFGAMRDHMGRQSEQRDNSDQNRSGARFQFSNPISDANDPIRGPIGIRPLPFT